MPTISQLPVEVQEPMAFLSHSSEDADWVRWMEVHAAALGVTLYLAEHDHQAGDVLSKKVIDAIEASDAVIVLLTASAYDSAFVQQEIGVARAKSKLVVPLVDTAIVHRVDLALLQGVEYIPFDFADPSADSTAAVMAAFRRITSSQSLATEVLPPGQIPVQPKAVISASADFSLDLQLDRDDLIVAGLIFGTIVALLYLASKSEPPMP